MRHIHFMGIGGIGMSALARIFHAKEVRITGTDSQYSAVVEGLKSLGMVIAKEYNASTMGVPDQVVYSTGISPNHPELLDFQKQGVPTVHRSILFLELLEAQRGLLISGTHGKTTTTGLLVHLLQMAGSDPSFAVGGILKEQGVNGHYGEGNYCVVEADESDGSFLNYSGEGAIILNLGFDHMSYWKDREAQKQGFISFAHQQKNKDLLFWCADDNELLPLQLPGHSYGFSPKAEVRLSSFEQKGFALSFNLEWNGKVYPQITAPLVGMHNALNIGAVFALGLQLGISTEVLYSGVHSFRGVRRRMDNLGEELGVVFFDDYAHHPNEVYHTLQGLKQAAPQQRLVVVFEPHRFSRLKDCLYKFPQAFLSADYLIVTDVSPGGEAPIEGVTAEVLVALVQERYPHLTCKYFPRNAALVDSIHAVLKRGDIVVTMGAGGGITAIGHKLVETRRASIDEQVASI